MDGMVVEASQRKIEDRIKIFDESKEKEDKLVT